MPGAPAVVWHSGAIPVSFPASSNWSAVLTLSQAVPAGSAVIVIAQIDANLGNPYSITDSTGQTYTNFTFSSVTDVSPSSITDFPTPGSHLLWYKTNHPGIPVGGTITATGYTFAALQVYVLRGVDNTTPIGGASKQRWENVSVIHSQGSGLTPSVSRTNVLLLGGVNDAPAKTSSPPTFSANEIAAPYTLAEIAQYTAFNVSQYEGTRLVSGYQPLTAASGTQSFSVNASATDQAGSGIGWTATYHEIFCIIVNGETNVAPNAPTLVPHGNFDPSIAQTFSWVFSDPNAIDSQTAYQLQILTNPGGTVVYDSGTVSSTTSSAVLPASTLSANTNYQWQVRTQDISAATGAYSALGSFSTAPPPTVAITAPVSDGVTVFTTVPTVTWTFTGFSGATQTSYHLVVQNGSTIVYDSGVVTSTALTQLVSALPTGQTYLATLTVVDSNGSTTAVTRTFFVLAPSPGTPTVSVGVSADGGAIQLTIDPRS